MEFMGGSSSFYATTLPSMVAVGIMVVEIYFNFDTWSLKTTWSRGHVTLRVQASNGKGPPCQVL